MTRWSKRLNLTPNVPHSFLNFIFLFTFSFVCLGKLFLLLSVEEWVLQSVHIRRVCAEQVLWKLLTLQTGEGWSREQAKGAVPVVSGNLLALYGDQEGRPRAAAWPGQFIIARSGRGLFIL